MRKHYFWAKETKGEKTTIFQFRSYGEANTFVSVSRARAIVLSIDPEVRRINRRIAAGEQLTFPIEI